MKVLAWRVAERLKPATTRSILLEALENAELHDFAPMVVTDSGVEHINGQTPDEVYAGTGDHVIAELAAAKAKARQQRIARNRAAHCPSCPKAA